MSNHVCNLNGGAKVEISVDGFTVVSVSGVRTKFDLSGNLIRQDTVDKKRYFFFMGKEERDVVKSWVARVECNTLRQEIFVKEVKEALISVKYDYWISTIEPSMNKKSKLFFAPGKKVLRGISCVEWEKKGEEFLPERNSGLASLHELFLWYAYRIANNLWSIEYVCDNSSGEGNYWNSPCPAGQFEVSGNRKVAGFADGIGNTCKIVMKDADFVVCGGYCSNRGNIYPVANVNKCEDPLSVSYTGSGVIVLRK